MNEDTVVSFSHPDRISIPDPLSLDIIVFGEIHNAALSYRSLQRRHFWSRGTSQRQEALVARL